MVLVLVDDKVDDNDADAHTSLIGAIVADVVGDEDASTSTAGAGTGDVPCFAATTAKVVDEYESAVTINCNDSNLQWSLCIIM